MGPHLSRAIDNLAYTTEEVPVGVLQSVHAAGSEPRLWPMVSEAVRGPIITCSGKVSDSVSLYEAQNANLVEKHVASESIRSRENWGGIAQASLLAAGLRSFRELCTNPRLTGLALSGANLLHIASGARLHADLWDSPEQIGWIYFLEQPFARSWDSKQSFNIWTSNDFIKSSVFQADIGNHDWTMAKAIVWAVALGYGTASTEHIRDSGDRGTSIKFYDCGMRASFLCGARVRPATSQVQGGAPDYDNADVEWSGDEFFCVNSAGQTPYQPQCMTARAKWIGGRDDGNNSHDGVATLPTIAPALPDPLIRGNQGIATVPAVPHPRAHTPIAQVDAWLDYLDAVYDTLTAGPAAIGALSLIHI